MRLVASALLMLFTAPFLQAQALPAVPTNFAIPAQSVADALNQFARQSGLRMLFSYEAVAGRQSDAIQGQYSPDDALRKLLDGTGLGYEVTPDSVVVIKAFDTVPVEPEVAATSSGAVSKAVDSVTSDAESAQSIGLEEVIVTAEKREESLQKTPISITALSAEDMEILRITDVLDLANTTSSVLITPFAGGRATPNIFIRGMGNTDQQMTKDNAVGVYIDGVPVGRNQGLAGDVADLERIEILRGPQGTLYGRNSTAGAVNLITARPQQDLSFQQQVGAGNYDLVWGRTTLNVPMADSFLLRAVYMTGHNDGWVKNMNRTLPNQTDFNMESKEALRASLRWLATEAVTVDYSYDFADLDFGNIFFQVAEGPTAPAGRQEAAQVTRGLSPSHSQSQGHNLTLHWNLDDVQVKSISGYRDLDYFVFQDYINRFNQSVHETMESWSQELQLVGSTPGKRLDYAVGAFYYREESTRDRLSDFQVAKDHSYVDALSTSVAAYLQATWTPPLLDDRIRLVLGTRFTHDERDATKIFVENGLAPNVPNGTTVTGDKSFDKFNPAFTIDYAIRNGVNAYVRYATGYRAGGFNSSSTTQGFSQGFDPENVKSYELGIKSEFFDRRVRLNTAFFQNDFTNLQVDQVRSPSIFTDTLNAAEATIRGAEFELTALLARGLTTTLSYAYLDATYDSYLDNGVDKAKLGTVTVPYAPESTLSASLKYESPPKSYGTYSFHVDYRAQDDYYSGTNPAYSHIEAYSLWNARAQLSEIPLPSGTLEVAFWGKNLADEKYAIVGAPLGLVSRVFGEPRTYGVDFSYRY